MFKIEVPNKNYNGTTWGVRFADGMGQTDSEDVKNVLVNDFGYSLIEDEMNVSNDTVNTNIVNFDDMEFNDLRTLAKDKGIDLGKNPKKMELIKALTETLTEDGE